MNDQFFIDSTDSTNSTDSTDTTEHSGQGSRLVGSLVCGAIPALLVGFGGLCYHTGYYHAVKEARPNIIYGSQNNTKIYNIAPSIGSNNNGKKTEGDDL